MREIKFRIWDNKLNIFSTPENNDAREFFIHFGGYRMIRCHDGYSQPTIVWDEEIKNRYSIQQYTGLKDKNGVEIYEGDIIHYKFDGASYPKEACDLLLTCIYCPIFGGYIFKAPNDSYYYAEIRSYDEVIGNIFDY